MIIFDKWLHSRMENKPMRPLVLGEPYRISCAVCGRACRWIEDEYTGPTGRNERGWYCERCDVFTEDRLED